MRRGLLLWSCKRAPEDRVGKWLQAKEAHSSLRGLQDKMFLNTRHRAGFLARRLDPCAAQAPEWGQAAKGSFSSLHRCSLCLTGGWSATAVSLRFQTQISPRNLDCTSEKSSCSMTCWWYVVSCGVL